MPVFMKVIATSLAVAVLGMALAAAPASADDGTSTASPATVAAPTDRQLNVAVDALRDVLNAMVDHDAMTPARRAAVIVAVRRADWDGYSIVRLGDILDPLVARGVITAGQRAAILDGVRHSRRNVFRLAAVLDTLTPSVLSPAQRDAIVDALHRADWDGFSIARLGDILQKLVDHGTITAAQRAAILDGMRR